MAETGRRDWTIAITAAVVGALLIPLIGWANASLKAAPRIVAELVYGPYVMVPDGVLKRFGYGIPDQFHGIDMVGELSIPDFAGGSGLASEWSRNVDAKSDIPSTFGDPNQSFILDSAYVANITIKNVGELPAKDIYIQSPFPGVALIKREDLSDVVLLKEGGSRLPIGTLQPGTERHVRLWLKYSGYDGKPFKEVRVLNGDKVAVVRRRGPDYIVNYLAAWGGPLLLICATAGALLFFAAAMSLIEASIKFLFFPPAAKPKNRGGSAPKKPTRSRQPPKANAP